MNTKNSKTATKTVGTKPQSVSDTKAPAIEKAAAKAHEAIDAASAKAENMEVKLRDKAADTQQKLGEKKAEASAQIENTLASMEAYIREKPLAAAGMAFAAGIIASRILKK